MASKSRFGYFSILPSHTAAKTDYTQKKGIHSKSIQPKKILMEKLKHSPEDSSQDPNQLKCWVKQPFHKSSPHLSVVFMLTLINPKDKGWWRKKRNGPNMKSSNQLVFKKLCMYLLILVSRALMSINACHLRTKQKNTGTWMEELSPNLWIFPAILYQKLITKCKKISNTLKIHMTTSKSKGNFNSMRIWPIEERPSNLEIQLKTISPTIKNFSMILQKEKNKTHHILKGVIKKNHTLSISVILDPVADNSPGTMDFLTKSHTNKKAVWKRDQKRQENSQEENKFSKAWIKSRMSNPAPQ